MSPLAILKLLKTAKDVHDYVKKPNNLDQQNEMILNRLDKLDNDSHPPIFEQKDKDALRQVYEICLENDDEGSDADVLSEPLTSLLKRLLK